MGYTGEINFCSRGAVEHLALMNVDVVVHNLPSEEANNRASADEGGGEVVIFMLSQNRIYLGSNVQP